MNFHNFGGVSAASVAILVVVHGITFLIIEHNMGLVAALCDHVVVLVQGKRFTEGRFSELRADHRVQEAYMGHRV